MKINEEYKDEGESLVIKKTHDFGPVLKQMEDLRQRGIVGMDGATDTSSEHRFIGRIPLALIEDWCKEAGISFNDVHARGEVVKRKILSGDFDKFRSDWKGNY